MTYRIQPNYRTVRLGFSKKKKKKLVKALVKCVPTYTNDFMCFLSL